MRPFRRSARSVAVWAVLSFVVLNVWHIETRAAGRPPVVVVTIGQPSIWTLEQAHYLLANMRNADLTLQSHVPSQEDLDPNQINSTNINLLQSYFGASAQYDATVALGNQSVLQQANANIARQSIIQQRIDTRNDQLDKLAGEIADINAQLAALGPSSSLDAAGQAKQAVLQGKLAAKQAQQGVINQQVSNLNTEFTNLSSNTPRAPSLTSSLPSSPVTQPSPLPTKTVLSQLLSSSTGQNAPSPKLQASIALDNYIQMQYEIIAKQLTLLRDDVGPDQRVIFLELPSSIYAVPAKAQNCLVQVRWSVTGYTTAKPMGPPTNDDCRDMPSPGKRDESNHTGAGAIHAIDIIPRQSAINVAETHDTQKGFALSAKFAAIFGFGAQVDYQRQREIYQQFIDQDIFASGFGKGESVFGWTFGPTPGSKSIAPGVKTTYAVLAVPRDTSHLQLQGAAYCFKRNEIAPATPADAPRPFDIEIPPASGGGYYVTRVDYNPVGPGRNVTVKFTGDYFSPDLGILVDGTPLQRVTSIGGIDSALSLPLAQSGISGAFEYVNAYQIIASFSAGLGYTGTPSIALVTPEKVSLINKYPLTVNGECGTLEKRSVIEPMFLPALSITGITVLSPKSPAENQKDVRIAISGQGFRSLESVKNGRKTPGAAIRINGKTIGSDLGTAYQDSTQRYVVTFPKPAESSWDITITENVGAPQQVTYTAQKPLAPQINYEVLRYSTLPNEGAKLYLRLYGQESEKILDAKVIDDDLGSVDSKKPLSSTGDMYVTLHAQTSPVLIEVTTTDAEKTIISIDPPLSPSITSVVNSATGKAQGDQGGNYPVTIIGRYLDHVQAVSFGGNAAQILQMAANGIVVQVPKGTPGQVPVVLTTDILYHGRALSNFADLTGTGNSAYFTYTATPAAPPPVVSPPAGPVAK